MRRRSRSLGLGLLARRLRCLSLGLAFSLLLSLLARRLLGLYLLANLLGEVVDVAALIGDDRLDLLVARLALL